MGEIQAATQEDLKRLSRRGFMNLLAGGAASVAVEPKKTFFFFGDVRRQKLVPATIDGLANFSPGMILIAGIGALAFALSLANSGKIPGLAPFPVKS